MAVGRISQDWAAARGRSAAPAARAQTLDGGTFCGVNNRPLVALPPDVLIVLDRSGSMDNDIADKGCTPTAAARRRDSAERSPSGAIMTPAIKQVVTATEGMVNWGLKFFADANNSGCT